MHDFSSNPDSALGLLAAACEMTLASFLFHIVTTEMFVKTKNRKQADLFDS